jgi:hypothetical protein
VLLWTGQSSESYMILGGEMCGELTFCVTGDLSQYFLNLNSHAVKYTVTVDVSWICFLLTETPNTETIVSVLRASVVLLGCRMAHAIFCHARTCVSHFRRVSWTNAKGDSFVMSVGSSVYVEQLSSRWVNIRESLVCRSLKKLNTCIILWYLFSGRKKEQK